MYNKAAMADMDCKMYCPEMTESYKALDFIKRNKANVDTNSYRGFVEQKLPSVHNS